MNDGVVEASSPRISEGAAAAGKQFSPWRTTNLKGLGSAKQS